MHVVSPSPPLPMQWIPLYPDGVPPVGPHDLPALVDTPPPHYSAVPAEGNNLPALKWMDGHRPLFRVTIAMESSVHPQDRHIMKFLRKFHEIQEVYDDGDVKGLLDAMQTLTSANSKALVKFLHVILDNLLTLVVWPAVTEDGKVVSQKAFMALARTVHTVHSLGLSVDKHGRNIILASFIQHVMQAPVGSFGPSARERRTTMLADARMVFEDDIEEKRRPSTMRGPASSKMAAGPAAQDSIHSSKKVRAYSGPYSNQDLLYAVAAMATRVCCMVVMVTLACSCKGLLYAVVAMATRAGCL